MKRKVLILGIGLLLMSGCAFGTKRPQFTYEPLTPQKPQNNISVMVDPFTTPKIWSQEEVKDSNGMGYPDSVLKNNIPEWIKKALEAELKNLGYSVVESGATNVIKGDVLETYYDMDMNFGGTVKIIVEKDGKVVLERSYSVTKNYESGFTATAESYERMIKMILQDTMKEALNDINYALLGV